MGRDKGNPQELYNPRPERAGGELSLEFREMAGLGIWKRGRNPGAPQGRSWGINYPTLLCLPPSDLLPEDRAH